MKGVVLRRKMYWFRARIEGKVVQFSLDTHDEAEAIRKAREFLNTASRPVVQAGFSTAAAIDAYISYKRSIYNRPSHLRFQRHIIECAFRDMGWGKPGDVTRHQVEGWMETKDNPRTRIQYTGVLSGFFAWMVEHRKVSANPCDGIKHPKKVPKALRKRFLAPEEARKLITTPCREDLKFAIYCALHAGLRYGEICAARPSWFDLKAGLLHVTAEADWQAKDGENRTVPLTQEFIRFLKKYGLRKPYMLRPQKKTGKHVYRVELRKPYEAHLTKCGIEDCTFHDLRRTFASLHVSAGTPLYIVAKWLGDGVGVVEKHYGHLHHSGDDIERAWEKKR